MNRLVALSLLFGVFLGACSQDPSVKKQQYLERGIKYHAEGKYNEAIIQLKNALQIDPKFAPAALALGRAFKAKSWTRDAMREVLRAADLAPNDLLPAHIELGQIYLDLEAWDEALATAKVISDEAPGHAVALYIRGAALHGKGESKEALELLENARAAGPPPQLMKVYGDVMAGLQRFDEAEKAYRAALAETPGHVDALLGLGELLLRRKNAPAALEILNQAKTAEPQNPKVRLALSAVRLSEDKPAEALKELEDLPPQTWSTRVVMVMGTLYLKNQQPDKAVATLRPLVQAMPDFAQGHYVLGHALVAIGRPEEAIAQFEAFVQRAPDNPIGRFSLGGAYAAAQRYREAAAEFERVRKPMEKIPDFHLQLARVQFMLGQPDVARKTAEVAIRLAPEKPQPYAALGAIDAARGDLKKAAGMYAKALEVDPKFTPGRVGLGYMYNAEKKPDDALREYEAALTANPRYAPAINAKVTTLVQQKRVDDAIAFVQAAAKTDPKNVALLTTLGGLYAQKKDVARAEEHFKRALAIDDKDVAARMSLAQLYFSTKKDPDGVALLQRILRDEPTNVAAGFALAAIHARQLRYDQAIAVLEPVVKRNPQAQELPIALASLYILTGRSDATIAILTPIVASEPNAVQARMLLGVGLLQKRDPAEAVKHFTRVNEINPNIGLNHYYLGQALLARGDVSGAQRAYQKAIELTPDSKSMRIELAALSGQKPDDALLTSRLAELKAGVDQDPSNVALRNALARAYLLRYQLKEAEVEYRRILDVAPTFVPANLALAGVRFQEKKADEAVEYLRAVIRTDPANLAANMLLGDYYDEKGNSVVAVQHFEAAYRANPTNQPLKVRLAYLYTRARRVEEAMPLAKDLIAAQPKSARAHQLLAELYSQRGNHAQAVGALTTAIRLEPKAVGTYISLAVAYERSNEPDKAAAAYRSAQALNPKHPVVLNNLAWLLASRGQNLDEALALAVSARKLTPNSAEILDTVGFVHYQRKEYLKAQQILRQAADLNPRVGSIHYHLGMTYHRLGRKAEAVGALKRSLQLDDRSADAAEARRVLKELGAS